MTKASIFRLIKTASGHYSMYDHYRLQF